MLCPPCSRLEDPPLESSSWHILTLFFISVQLLGPLYTKEILSCSMGEGYSARFQYCLLYQQEKWGCVPRLMVRYYCRFVLLFIRPISGCNYFIYKHYRTDKIGTLLFCLTGNRVQFILYNVFCVHSVSVFCTLFYEYSVYCLLYSVCTGCS